MKENPAGRGDKQLCPTLFNNSRQELEDPDIQREIDRHGSDNARII